MKVHGFAMSEAHDVKLRCVRQVGLLSTAGVRILRRSVLSRPEWVSATL